MSTPMNGSTPTADAPLSRWQKARMVIKVVELRLRFIALMAVTGLVFGYWDTIVNTYEKWARPAATRTAASPAEEYYCPMHPTVVQGEPGGCPICGMPLSKRAKGGQAALPDGVLARVALSPERVAQAGVATLAVDYRPLAETVTTVGSVAIDERRLARIASKTRGMARVEKLLVNFTGVEVKAGQPLAEVYSPELEVAIRELLVARDARSERASTAPRSALGRELLGGGGKPGTDLVGLAREKLSRWGITAAQVDAILAGGKVEPRVPILATIGGVVVRKLVVEGQYVNEGEALFEVADLSRVWVQARVYEDQIGLVREGQAVEATVEAFPGEVFRGTVAFRDPTLDPATRTLGVRYDLPNADGRLRPGMFATVTLTAPVADSPAFRDRVARRDDSKPRRTTRLAVADQKTCPVTKQALGSMGDPIAVEVEGQGLWVCCAGCETPLKATPAKYLARLEGPPSGEILAVPESAVIDTGTRKVVFVEAEPGVFEARAVVLGPPAGDLYPVLEGLAFGDKVAAAGAFLLDAETRLKGTSGPPTAPAPTPAIAADTKHAH